MLNSDSLEAALHSAGHVVGCSRRNIDDGSLFESYSACFPFAAAVIVCAAGGNVSKSSKEEERSCSWKLS